MRSLLPNIAESAMTGLVLGVASGHFSLALVPAAIGAAVFAAGRLGIALLTEEIDAPHR